MYRSIGGDSDSLERRQFAARTSIYLILSAVAQLTPNTNPENASGFEHELEEADRHKWISINPQETHAGGAYWKVIRWAFEKQGLFKAPGALPTAEGAPPAVDVYIDDGRHGEYPFQPIHAYDIWNRLTIGEGGGVHEEPVTCQTNYAYVRIKNRGTQMATNVVVDGFYCPPDSSKVFPKDWISMNTKTLSVPNIAANDSVGVVVGPFKWLPELSGQQTMFFSVSATNDESNIDRRITGSIPDWRLVPHDNNIGQRDVIAVEGKGRCPFKFSAYYAFAWAWIIYLGGLIITPGGIGCTICDGFLAFKAIGVILIAFGITGFVTNLARMKGRTKNAAMLE